MSIKGMKLTTSAHETELILGNFQEGLEHE